MKYYKADAKAQRRIITILEKKILDSVEQTAVEESSVMNSYISGALNEEIRESRLYKYARRVDAVYYEHAVKHYSGFTKITDTVISPAESYEMCIDFREEFPACHTVFSKIVSASSYRIKLATSFSAFEIPRDVDIGDACDATDDDGN